MGQLYKLFDVVPSKISRVAHITIPQNVVALYGRPLHLG